MMKIKYLLIVLVGVTGNMMTVAQDIEPELSAAIENRSGQTASSPFGLNYIEYRGQLYHDGEYAHQIEYKRRWFDLLSTDVFVRSFHHSSFELGGGITIRLPFVQMFYTQAAASVPFNDAYPGGNVLPDCGLWFPFKPDYSYTLRGGMLIPLGNPATFPFYLTFSTGKSWYVDNNFRRVHWLSTDSDMPWSGEYEVRTHKVTKEYGMFEAGIGIHF